MNVTENILGKIGGTPMVRINRLNRGGASVFAKIESFNPGGSAKDRVALAMVDEAERSGRLKSGATIIEPTSGNTGVALALVAAVRGYRLILTMPETMSVERRKLAAAYGAQIVLTDGAKGMQGAIGKALKLHSQIPGSFIAQQFENPANPACHRSHTGPEIWEDTDGKVDVFETHDMVDNLERELRDQYKIDATIHMDPIVTDDALVNTLREKTALAVSEIDSRLRIHDFRFVAGNTHSNLIFDVAAPFEVKMSDEDLCATIAKKISEIDPTYYTVVTVDRE